MCYFTKIFVQEREKRRGKKPCLVSLPGLAKFKMLLPLRFYSSIFDWYDLTDKIYCSHPKPTNFDRTNWPFDCKWEWMFPFNFLSNIQIKLSFKDAFLQVESSIICINFLSSKTEYWCAPMQFWMQNCLIKYMQMKKAYEVKSRGDEHFVSEWWWLKGRGRILLIWRRRSRAVVYSGAGTIYQGGSKQSNVRQVI